MGGISAAFGPEYALGFVEETENQVLDHLRRYVQRLPKEDKASQKVLEQMIIDEQAHASEACHMGAVKLPAPVKDAMSIMGHILTSLAYWK